LISSAKENKMIILLIVSIVVFGYLLYVLIKPEKF
jgi:K+-transporting ATPase KdpF subunit